MTDLVRLPTSGLISQSETVSLSLLCGLSNGSVVVPLRCDDKGNLFVSGI